MGAPALLASQAVNNAADAGHALGTMGGGGKLTRALEGTASMGGTAATHTAMDAAEVEKMARAAARAHLADVGGDHAKAISGLEQVAAMAESDPRVARRLPVINRTIELLRGKTSVAPTAQEAKAIADEAASAARDQAIMDRGAGNVSGDVGPDPRLTKMLRSIRDPESGGGTTMGTMGGQPRPRGLGNRLSELMAGGTEAERAALAKRLEAEAGQAGGQSSAVPRDQALANLIDQPEQAKPLSRVKDDYAGQHGAPDAESGSPIYDVTANGTYPQDFYSHNGLRYYGTGDEALDRSAYQKIQSFKNNPDAMVKVWRAVPWEGKGKRPGALGGQHLNPGDWVAISRQYAIDHGESALNGNYALIATYRPARELFTAGDSMHEWGWSPTVPP
jgi:hypothetical protein